MSKKLDFLRDQQSRRKHPQRHQVGSPADAAAGATQPTRDRQTPHTGKVANDHNRSGDPPPSQTNQARRTPQSRHDRQTIGAGPQNQTSARKGGGHGGRKPSGGG